MRCPALLFALCAVVLVSSCGASPTAARTGPVPVAIMHGILGKAAKMDPVIEWTKAILPDAYVRSIEVGNGALDSVFMPLNLQVELFCEAIYADKNYEHGFNLIGFSQGGLLARGYIQRCNKYPVINFMSWASPQAGVFGGLGEIVPGFISVLLNETPYNEKIQNNFALFQYWRDPYNLEAYREGSHFLADLNNEREEKNETYKENIKSLKTMMLLYSVNDEVVNPPQSAWFESFLPYTGPGDKGVIVPMQKSLLYIQDWLGLKELHVTGRLQRHKGNCTHESHPTASCKRAFDLYSAPLLKEPWPEIESFWSKQQAGSLPRLYTEDEFAEGQ